MMANKFNFKMGILSFSFLIILNSSFLFAKAEISEKCSCYYACEKNFTKNSFEDPLKIAACQRGCRFYFMELHITHKANPAKDSAQYKQNCLLSCSESYKKPTDRDSCNFGCSAEEAIKSCSLANRYPPFGYFFYEESNVLIHPGEPDPDDSLTDPSLRKQVEKTLAALFDVTPKIPEIHFKNLPAKAEKQEEALHLNYKCPKFYGLDSKFEFRNGKIIIGDLYLFLIVFFFVVLCFVLGHHIETKNMAKQLMEARISKKEEKEPLLKMDLEQEEIICKEKLPDYFAQNSSVMETKVKVFDHCNSKFDSKTLVFHDDEKQQKEEL